MVTTVVCLRLQSADIFYSIETQILDLMTPVSEAFIYGPKLLLLLQHNLEVFITLRHDNWHSFLIIIIIKMHQCRKFGGNMSNTLRHHVNSVLDTCMHVQTGQKSPATKHYASTTLHWWRHKNWSHGGINVTWIFAGLQHNTTSYCQKYPCGR